MFLLLFVCGLWLGNPVTKVMEAYYQGLWMLLPFTMQMTLIITLSAVLGSSRLFRNTILALARLPRTRNEVVIVSVLVTSTAAYLYWGLGIALGPLVAVYFAREAERKGIAVDFLFLLGLATAANATWQYGLSASAPLLVATPGHFLEKTIGVIPLGRTIWSPAAIVLEIVFVATVIALGCLLMPANPRPISSFPGAGRLVEPTESGDPAAALSYSERLERTGFGAGVLCLILAGWLYVHFFVRQLSLDINSLNTTLLLACLLVHRNVHAFASALRVAVVSAWPVIVIYHIYACVAGLVQFTSTGESLAGAVASLASPGSFPLVNASLAALFSIFIPSSGGQWAVQGFVVVKAAAALGISVERAILSMGVGDHIGNLTSPFWYVVFAGIANVDFRSFFGYGLLFALLWFILGVAAFTFLPC
jgi:short-chain fatty acids transporter